jgi:hypothetical protein
MADVSRRGFLTQVSIATGVGVAGGFGLHKLLAPTGDTQPPQMQAPLEASEVTLAGPMLVHIRDVATGEVAVMVGTQELVYQDAALVSHLVRTAARAANREG